MAVNSTSTPNGTTPNTTAHSHHPMHNTWHDQTPAHEHAFDCRQKASIGALCATTHRVPTRPLAASEYSQPATTVPNDGFQACLQQRDKPTPRILHPSQPGLRAAPRTDQSVSQALKSHPSQPGHQVPSKSAWSANPTQASLACWPTPASRGNRSAWPDGPNSRPISPPTSEGNYYVTASMTTVTFSDGPAHDTKATGAR